MKAALIDNGSLQAAAHVNLRLAASAIGLQAGIPVDAVSWKHSDKIPAYALADGPAWTLARWVRGQVAGGEREFTFIPYFVSPQGAVGSFLSRDIEAIRSEVGGFDYAFTEGLTAGVLSEIVADRARESATEKHLGRSAVVVVDHGGPSAASAAVRNQVASGARDLLAGAVSAVAAASMESPDGDEFAFNRPLLADALALDGFNAGDVLIAPLFLSPGRHAGPGGDLAVIARKAEARAPGLRCHFCGLVGSHPLAIDQLAQALARASEIGAHP